MSTDLEPTPARRRAIPASLWKGVRGALSWTGARLAANRGSILGALAMLAVFIALWQPSIPIRLLWIVAPPQRSIYIDSPEVYSRERLINERLSEEAWLNQELEAASGTDKLTGRMSTVEENISAMLTAPGVASEAAPEGADGDDVGVRDSGAATSAVDLLASFDQVFKLRSSYRSLIRQRLIENKLDDRHDLEGNSLYILKFDTTVLSVPATRDRAVVRIRILPPRELQAIDASSPAFRREAGLDTIEDPDLYRFLSRTYEEWKSSLEARVNARISQLYGNFQASPSSYLQGELLEYMTSKLVSVGTLAEDLERTSGDDRLELLRARFKDARFRRAFQSFFAIRAAAEVTGVALPDLNVDLDGTSEKRRIDGLPFAEYLSPTIVEFQETLRFPPKVTFFHATIYASLIDGDCAKQLVDHPSNEQVVFRGNLDLPQKQYAMYSFQDFAWSPAAFRNALLYALTKHFEGAEGGNGWHISKGGYVEGFKDCPDYFSVGVDSGLLSFASKVSSFNSYSYSVLPRESPIGVMNEILQTRSAIGKATSFSASRATRESLRGFELRPTLTTFGDIELEGGEPGRRRPPIVGWVIDPSAANMGTLADFEPRAVSESVLAIISVPAWWSSIRLDVEKTWWSEHATRRRFDSSDDISADGRSGSMVVRLPNKYELLAGLLTDDTRRSPAITGIDVSPVQNCNAFRVLIMGERLWRNTAVTIGSYKASKIEVLPNMEGILAEFTDLGDPQISGGGDLLVWTSEGVASLPRELVSTFRPRCGDASIPVSNR